MAISTRTLKDGTTVYDVRVTVGFKLDGKPDRRSVTVRTKRAAQIEEAKMIAERAATRGRSGRMTLGQYIDNNYWPIAKNRLAAYTLDTYAHEIRNRIRPTFGDTDIRDIDRVAIQRMLDAIPTEPVAKKALSTLKTILNEAKADGLITLNPATAKYALPPKGRKRDNGLVLTSFDQIADFAAIVAQRAPERLQAIVMLGVWQGLRPGERYALDWDDIDADNATLTINGAYIEASKAHGGLDMKQPKTEQSLRTIPMHPKFAEWLSTMPESSGPFIVTRSGERMSQSNGRQQWKRFLAKNPDVPPVTVENMRHSFATAYLDAGGRIEVLSKLLGHTNIQTTIDRYYRPDVDALRNDIFA